MTFCLIYNRTRTHLKNPYLNLKKHFLSWRTEQTQKYRGQHQDWNEFVLLKDWPTHMHYSNQNMKASHKPWLQQDLYSKRLIFCLYSNAFLSSYLFLICLYTESISGFRCWAHCDQCDSYIWPSGKFWWLSRQPWVPSLHLRAAFGWKNHF